MTNLNILLSPDLEKLLEGIAQGTGFTREEIVYRALTLYAEEHAVSKVLLAAKEPSIDGDLKTILNTN